MQASLIWGGGYITGHDARYKYFPIAQYEGNNRLSNQKIYTRLAIAKNQAQNILPASFLDLLIKIIDRAIISNVSG